MPQGLISWQQQKLKLVVVTLASFLFTNASLQRFTTFLGRFRVLLIFFVLIQYPGTGYQFLEPVDRAVNAFVVFYVNSNHLLIHLP